MQAAIERRRLLKDADQDEVCFSPKNQANYFARNPWNADAHERNALSDRGDWAKCIPSPAFGIMCIHAEAHALNPSMLSDARRRRGQVHEDSPMEGLSSTKHRGQLHDWRAGVLYESLAKLHDRHCAHLELNLTESARRAFNDYMEGVGDFQWPESTPEPEPEPEGEPEPEPEGEPEPEPESEPEGEPEPEPAGEPEPEPRPEPNCKDWDVKLDGVTPEVYKSGMWHPICGHYFWDNNNGVETFCKMLGGSGGTIHGRRGTYSTDAMFIPQCHKEQEPEPESEPEPEAASEPEPEPEPESEPEPEPE